MARRGRGSEAQNSSTRTAPSTGARARGVHQEEFEEEQGWPSWRASGDARWLAAEEEDLARSPQARGRRPGSRHADDRCSSRYIPVDAGVAEQGARQAADVNGNLTARRRRRSGRSRARRVEDETVVRRPSHRAGAHRRRAGRRRRDQTMRRFRSRRAGTAARRASRRHPVGPTILDQVESGRNPDHHPHPSGATFSCIRSNRSNSAWTTTWSVPTRSTRCAPASRC
jgi:hypothetical protein